jgi:hypothetical protein
MDIEKLVEALKECFCKKEYAVGLGDYEIGVTHGLYAVASAIRGLTEAVREITPACPEKHRR